MNNPTCPQCDCVAGCQANPKVCPNLAAISQLKQQANLAERIQREIDHCVMNDLRLVSNFGKRKGDFAVRVSSLEAILETSTQPKDKP